MHPRFASFAERLHPAFERLLACEPVTGGIRLPLRCAQRGVYLFSERGRHLYVGRTNRLRDRHHEHWRPRGKHNDAPFAFRLAREATGHAVAKGGMTRTSLEAHPDFQLAFDKAKMRIAAMDFRWVEESDPNTQCLLEVYASITLETPFNDFDNH